MSPSEEALTEARRCLDQLTVESLAATPKTIRPFGEGSTLEWDIKGPPRRACPGLSVTLDGSGIGSPAGTGRYRGTRHVQPAVTTVFELEASMRTLKRTLGDVSVIVDTSQCISGSIPEDEIRQEIRDKIEAVLESPDFPQLSQRTPAYVEIDSSGIAIRLRWRLSIEDFTDPDLNVDFKVGVRAVNGSPVATYRNFDVEVDWPWWVTLISLGISEAVEEVIADKIEDGIKPYLLDELHKTMRDYLKWLPESYRLYHLRTESDAITYTVCPVPQ